MDELLVLKKHLGFKKTSVHSVEKLKDIEIYPTNFNDAYIGAYEHQ